MSESDNGQYGRLPMWVQERLRGEPYAKELYAWIAGRYADAEGEAFPKREMLAEDLGYSIKTIERALSVLRAKGVAHTWQRRDAAGYVTGLRYKLFYHLSDSPVVQADTKRLVSRSVKNSTKTTKRPISRSAPERLTGGRLSDQPVAAGSKPIDPVQKDRTATVVPSSINQVPTKEIQSSGAQNALATPDVARKARWGIQWTDRAVMELELSTMPAPVPFASSKQEQLLGHRIFEADPNAGFHEHTDRLLKQICDERMYSTQRRCENTMLDVYRSHTPRDQGFDRWVERAIRRGN